MDKLGSNIPGPGGMSQYTLFPSKKKRGGGHQQRSKKSPEKQHSYTSSGGSRGNESVAPHHKIMSRKPRDTDTWDRDGSQLNPFPARIEGSPSSWSAQSNQRSFADMVKAPPAEKKIASSLKQDSAEVLPSGKKFVRKSVRDERVVLNQISATTYNKIGRSDDRSKYVMSGREDEGEAESVSSVKRKMKTIPSAVRSDIEVEFRASGEDSDNETDDFQVEFSSSAAIRRPKEAGVNKISALTFQQIGRTSSDHETYVMKPSRSWSAVVGRRTVTSSNHSNSREQNTEVQDEPERSREPTVHDKIKAKIKEGIELTTEERELLREKRRERRKREKEKKNKEKENKARQDMLRPQTTKLNFISGDVLNLVKNNTNPQPGAKNIVTIDKGIKFMDEEYPDLGAKKKQNIVISTEIRDESGRICSDRESNSEWETEDDQDHEQEAGEAGDEEKKTVEIVTEQRGPVSYSSILKSAKKTAPTPGLLKVKIKPEEKKVDTQGVAEKKKVKKNDPIMFDFNSAIIVKQSKEKKKNATVVTGKLKKDPKVARNQLDSSAPAKKRGKEREGGKKKRKSVMKKIIIAEREKRRTEAEKRREERIKQGITLKPLLMSDDFNEAVTEDNRNIVAEKTGEEKHLDKVAKISEEPPQTIESQIVQECLERSVEDKARDAVHSRKFRPYCTHLLAPEVNTAISSLMSDLIRFQDKQYAKDPDKAKAKRRYVVGLREVAKFLKVKKIKAIIFAPDIEKVETEGGLDDAVGKLLSDSVSMEVPTFFGLNRYKLGKLCLKKVPISCIGILNYQGSDVSIFRKIVIFN